MEFITIKIAMLYVAVISKIPLTQANGIIFLFKIIKDHKSNSLPCSFSNLSGFLSLQKKNSILLGGTRIPTKRESARETIKATKLSIDL